jgi:TPP-dependent 2-oxoacid decarboxylase
MNIADYLVHRLQEIGIRRLFSVPGDYTLALLDHFLPSGITLVGTCNELNAAYAADGYARVNGVGALCVTYGVGGLSALNGVAGSFAERVPVVVVSGGPSRAQRGKGMVHHMAGEYTAQLECYSPVTAAARIIDNPQYAASQIDEMLVMCLHEKRPVYIELPTDVLALDCGEPKPLETAAPPSSEVLLKKVVGEAVKRIGRAQRPVILSGVEVLRYHLEDKVARLCQRTGIPFATGLLGKSSVDETAPGYFGVYQGGLSRPEVKDLVEQSDALLILGGWIADSSTGGFTHGGEAKDVISANVGKVRFGEQTVGPVSLEAFLDGLTDALPETPRPMATLPSPVVYGQTPYMPQAGRPLTMARFVERVQAFLDKDMLLLADTGDALFWSAEMRMPAVGAYVCQGYYLSIGYSVPAALGLSLAAPDKRVVVLVGDGAFQMTCQELSTIVRTGQRPIVFVLNNDGYAIERAIHDGPYNEIARWKYHRLTEVLGGRGFDVRTEDELEKALEQAKASAELSLVEIHVGRDDVSPTFQRFAEILNRPTQA